MRADFAFLQSYDFLLSEKYYHKMAVFSIFQFYFRNKQIIFFLRFHYTSFFNYCFVILFKKIFIFLKKIIIFQIFFFNFSPASQILAFYKNKEGFFYIFMQMKVKSNKILEKFEIEMSQFF